MRFREQANTPIEKNIPPWPKNFYPEKIKATLVKKEIHPYNPISAIKKAMGEKKKE